MSTVAHADTHGHDHPGPPPANMSSRVDSRLLGIYLFIASEIMLFGSFFTALFFARVVVAPDAWPPEGFHLPVYLALVNTIILVTSSFTMHWALQSIKRNYRAGLIAGLTLTFLLGLTFLLIQAREYTRIDEPGTRYCVGFQRRQILPAGCAGPAGPTSPTSAAAPP